MNCMDIKKIQSDIELILSSGCTTAKKDVEIILASLEKENEVRFEIAITSISESCCNEGSYPIVKDSGFFQIEEFSADSIAVPKLE